MRTVRCSGCRGVSARGGVCSGGCLPRGVSAKGQSKRHQKFKTGVKVAPQNGPDILQKIQKKKK